LDRFSKVVWKGNKQSKFVSNLKGSWFWKCFNIRYDLLDLVLIFAYFNFIYYDPIDFKNIFKINIYIYMNKFYMTYMISVKKELNRLYILGTLITWFASYLTKSSQILKNHSIMLFTSNANSL